jgi:hypothetical protein
MYSMLNEGYPSALSGTESTDPAFKLYWWCTPPLHNFTHEWAPESNCKLSEQLSQMKETTKFLAGF